MSLRAALDYSCLFSHSCVGKVLTGFLSLKFHWSTCYGNWTNVFHPELFHGHSDGKDSLSQGPVSFTHTCFMVRGMLRDSLSQGPRSFTKICSMVRVMLQRDSISWGPWVFHQDLFHGQHDGKDSLSQGPLSFTQTCFMVRVMLERDGLPQGPVSFTKTCSVVTVILDSAVFHRDQHLSPRLVPWSE